jgi:hypothetical protein
MRDRRCAHLAPSVTSLEPRASCVAVATRTSRGVACSPALEVPSPRGPGDAVACPDKGTVFARPLDRGAAAADLGTVASTPDGRIAATARRGRGVAATVATARRGRGAAATAATSRGPPPRALSGNRRPKQVTKTSDQLILFHKKSSNIILLGLSGSKYRTSYTKALSSFCTLF